MEDLNLSSLYAEPNKNEIRLDCGVEQAGLNINLFDVKLGFLNLIIGSRIFLTDIYLVCIFVCHVMSGQYRGRSARMQAVFAQLYPGSDLHVIPPSIIYRSA